MGYLCFTVWPPVSHTAQIEPCISGRLGAIFRGTDSYGANQVVDLKNSEDCGGHEGSWRECGLSIDPDSLGYVILGLLYNSAA